MTARLSEQVSITSANLWIPHSASIRSGPRRDALVVMALLAFVILTGCGGKGVLAPSPVPSPTPETASSNGRFRALRSLTAALSRSAISRQASAPTANMAYTRASATATLLADGRVLVAGGSSDPIGTYTAEIFDPSTETFSLLDSKMSWGRMDHCAVTLADHMVLLIGGLPMTWVEPISFDLPSTVDLFDPATDTITAHTLSGPLPITDNGPTKCFPLTGNRVLIVSLNTGLMILETNTWQTRTLNLAWGGDSQPIYSSVDRTPDGRIWIVSGRFGYSIPFVATPSLWWFDPNTESVSMSGQLLQDREGAGILAFPDNSVEVYGGAYVGDPMLGETPGLSSVERVDSAGVSSKIGDLPMPKSRLSSVMLQNGRSLHVGGSGPDGCASGSQYVFDETTHISGVTGDMTQERADYGITPLATGRVLIVGGNNCSGEPSNTAEIFEPDARIYIVLSKTTVAAGESVQLSAETSIPGTITWTAIYGTVNNTGEYTAPLGNPGGDAIPTLADEVTATLATGEKAVAPISVEFPAYGSH